MTQADAPTTETPPVVDEIVAEPDVGYRWKHLIMAVLMIAGGAWFAYDGWINWPRMNQNAVRVEKELEAAQRANNEQKKNDLAIELRKYEKHNDASILIQKILAITLPSFGLFWGIWTIRATRGSYRLGGDTLHVPGHPPVTFNNIRRIDKRRWDRKGIAYLHYEHGQPAEPGILKLDDFAYQRKETDEILERIERNVLASLVTTRRSV
jgi:hypothetical protein